jgi:hypothetical protein
VTAAAAAGASQDDDDAAAAAAADIYDPQEDDDDDDPSSSLPQNDDHHYDSDNNEEEDVKDGWSSLPAAVDDEQIYRGVVGNFEYTHVDVLKSHPSSHPWRPCPQHDMASLGFTMAVAQNHFVLPWDTLQYGVDRSNVSAFEEFDAKRVAAAKEILHHIVPALTRQWFRCTWSYRSQTTTTKWMAMACAWPKSLLSI